MPNRLAEVARKVGVSEATVSRVLNDKPGVSNATRQAVLTALDVLGYERPTKLRGERARLVGLVLPELHNPIFAAFAEVIGRVLVQHGYSPVLCIQNASGVTEAEYVDLLLAQQVSGVIFVGGDYTLEGADHEHYERLRQVNLPTALVNAHASDLAFAAAATDDAVAVEQAVQHVHQLGHRRIAVLLGPEDHVPSQRKLDAARLLLDRLGAPLADELIARGVHSLESGQAGAARLYAAGATAIVCSSDLLALGAIRAARRAGLAVPGDVSIVGFDDSPLMSCTEPPLTTVRQPIEPMGRAVVEMLLGQISGAVQSGDEVLFEPELVLRSSTGSAV